MRISMSGAAAARLGSAICYWLQQRKPMKVERVASGA
jgi:hypothetical protein